MSAHPSAQGQGRTYLWWPLRLTSLRTACGTRHGSGNGSYHWSPFHSWGNTSARATQPGIHHLSSLPKPHSALEEAIAPSIVLRGSPALLKGKPREARTLFMSPMSLTAQALGSVQAAAAELCTLQEAMPAVGLYHAGQESWTGLCTPPGLLQ